MIVILRFHLSILYFFATLRQHVSQITLEKAGTQARLPSQEQYRKWTQSPEAPSCAGQKARCGEYEEVEITAAYLLVCGSL